MSESLRTFVRKFIARLQTQVNRIWYEPALGLLAAIDNFLVFIPTDGILISSSMLVPRKWIALALAIALGSTVGAIFLAWAVGALGLPWILQFFPGLDQSETWAMSLQFFNSYGLLVLFMVGVTPFVQQPAVILAALASTPLYQIAIVVFLGRFIKYLTMAYIGAHAPRLLGKLWGVKGELREVGYKID